jgi:hypothetical protein
MRQCPLMLENYEKNNKLILSISFRFEDMGIKKYRFDLIYFKY